MEQKNYKEILFSKEIKKSFLDYAMSVIVSRALPDVRDGLKPVQRRIIYGMNVLGAVASSPYKKSARITGDIMGKYHPHGDSSIYDALVRMSQWFSYRSPLVDGHGNFGSIDGDGAAASRYTEARMSRLSMELVRDINKDTVDFVPNYDGEEVEPVILPSKFPNLLVNGSTGIAVGMATNIPPHNLAEVIDGTVALLDNPNLEVLNLMEYIKGPDFPTGATILGNQGIVDAYTTGRGSVTTRSKIEIVEHKNGKTSLIVREIPYMIRKSSLVKKIAELVRDKVIDGITDLRDESNREGIKIVIELRRDANVNVVLNNLYKYSQLQQNFGINMLALVDNVPRVLNLKEILEKYIEHQKVIIIRRTKFDLDKAEKRYHIVQGLIIAVNNIDEVIKIIKSSKNDEESIEKLTKRFDLTETQVRAILEMKLRRLTGLEREKLEKELKELELTIADLRDILANEQRIIDIIKEELTEIKNKYADERRTKIDMTAIDYIEDEALIPEENILITLTNKGYIKRLADDTFKTQNRGGVGIRGLSVNDEDYPEKIINMNTHEYLLLFSNFGKVYRIKGYEVPEYSRQSKGLPIVNLIALEKGEKINSILTASEENNEEANNIVFVTKQGTIKRTALSEFLLIRKNGKIAITLKDEDELISVRKSAGDKQVIVGISNGNISRFNEEDVRSVSRGASGVKAVNLGKNEFVVGAELVDDNDEILIISENGYGKRVKVRDFRLTKRGSKGVKGLDITKKTGNLFALRMVEEDKDAIIVSDDGITIRIKVSQISVLGRVTQGVKLINLKDGQKVSAVTIVEEENTKEEVE